MKKILFIFTLFIIATLKVNALTPDYTIEGFYVDATIKENGDMLVKEAIVQRGNFNGFSREIGLRSNNDLYEASEIEIIKVCEAYGSTFSALNNVSSCFTQVSLGSNGDFLVYEKTNYDGGYALKMFNYTNGGYKTYYIEYLLKDIVIVHNDVAEFRWNFVPKSFRDNIEDVEIIVNLPRDSSTLRVWTHGPLYGENEILNKKSIKYSDNGIARYTPVDVRMVFDKDIVSNVLKRTSSNMLDKIVEEETELADRANEEREKAQNIEMFKMIFVFLLSIGWIIGLIIIWIHMYRKYDKEYKSEFKEKYFRDFPGDYSPEIVQYLMEKKINTTGLSASLLNIIRKKGLKVEETKIEKGVIFKKEEKDYLLTKEEEKEPLTGPEDMLRNWLLMYYGDNNQFAISSMKKKIKNEAEARAFMKKYNEWTHSAQKEAVKEEFYEDHSSKKVLPILYGLIPIMLLLFGLSILMKWVFILVILSVIGLGFSIYVGVMNKRTPKGNEHYMKWNALKNFLNDFGRFKDKELPEIYLWEKYLVYATVFGVAEKLRKDMEIKLHDIPDSNIHLNTFNYLYLNHAINQAITHSVVSAFSAATKEIAASARSSGGGFGGGSSFGGGGGGGSGGGGGF